MHASKCCACKAACIQSQHAVIQVCPLLQQQSIPAGCLPRHQSLSSVCISLLVPSLPGCGRGWSSYKAGYGHTLGTHILGS